MYFEFDDMRASPRASCAVSLGRTGRRPPTRTRTRLTPIAIADATTLSHIAAVISRLAPSLEQ